MYGYRKFFLTLAGLISFTMIGFKSPQADFLSLGIGIGMVIAPVAAANAMKYKYQKAQAEQNG